MSCLRSSLPSQRPGQPARAALLTLFIGLASVSALSLTGCGARSSDQQSTNTGNPPLIDHGEISVELVGDKVKVTGDAGAVSPGGAQVKIVNLTSDATVETEADADGSFAAELPGELDDGYNVSVENAGENTSFTLSLKGSSVCGHSEPTETSLDAQCSDIELEARCQVIGAVTPDLLACDSDDDCEQVSLSTSCYDYCNPVAAMAKASRAEFKVALDRVDETVCDEHARLDCGDSLVLCAEEPPSAPACVAGRCELVPDSGEIEAQIEAELDRLNHCEVVEDCEGVNYPNCSTS